MNRTYLIAVSAIALLALGAVAFAAYDRVRPESPENVATSTIEAVTPIIHEYGQVTLILGEEAQFKDVSIRPLAVTEDSRCPKDVQCIQAGTVVVSTRIVSGMGTSTNAIRLGQSVTTEAETITFVSVLPEKMSGDSLRPGDYQFTFKVEKRRAAEVAPPALGKCYVGGCSSQLCSDKPDMASTCEYRESYACYRGATCTRQATGVCGWTQTPALTSCLLSAGT